MLNRLRFAGLRVAVLKRLRNRRFWRDSGLLMLANVIVLVLGLVRTPAMTWLLPKEQVGMMGVVAAWVPFLQLLSLSGLDTASYHYVAKGQPWAFRVNLSYRLRWSLLSAVGFLAVAAYWWWRSEIPLAWMFIITGLSSPVTLGLTACGGMLGAQENFIGLFWYRLGESLTDFVGFVPILFSMWFVNQAVTFYGANLAATAVMQISVSVWLVRQLHQSKTPVVPIEDTREMIRYGKHQTLISSIGVVQSRTDALLISTFFPLTTMADYSIAQLVYAQFKRLWTVYYGVRYPPIVRYPLARRQRRVIIEMSIVGVAFVLLGLIMGASLWFIIPVILPQDYVSSLPFINWLIATFVIGVPGYFAEMYFRTRQDERTQYLLRGIAAVSGILFPVLFLFFWQVKGVIIGRFVASFVLSALGLLLFWRDKGKSDPSFVAHSININTDEENIP